MIGTDYLPAGNFSESVSYDEKGVARDKRIHTFDNKGRPTGYEEYSGIPDKTLSLPRKHVYTLDEAGRKIQYTVYGRDGSVEHDSLGAKGLMPKEKAPQA